MSTLSGSRFAGRLVLFGDNTTPVAGLTAERVSGHTPGQLFIRVRHRAECVVLASGADNFYEELESDMPFTAIADIPRMYEDFTQLRTECGDTFGILVPGHHPAASFESDGGFPGDDAVAICRHAE